MTKTEQIVELIEQLRKLINEIDADAYARGCQDAMNNVIQAAQSSLHPAYVSSLVDPIVPPASEQKRVPRGTVPKVVMETLAERDGLTTVQVTDKARQRDSRISPHSVRTTLPRLVKRGEIKRLGAKWYIAQRRLVDDKEAQNAGHEEPALGNTEYRSFDHAPT